MMLAGIRSIYAEHQDDRQDEVYKDYLGVRDRRTRVTEPRLALNTTNESIFQDLVIEHVSTQDLASAKKRLHPSPSNALLIDAAQFVRGAIAERVGAARHFETFLLELEDFIRDRIILILVAVGDEADAYLIFETLNDRGLDLSISDLLKNYVYGRAGNRLAIVQKQWEEMVVLLGSQDATQFLRHYWLSKYGVVRERDLYRELRSKFASAQQVLSLMAELRSTADKYTAMSNVDHAVWKGQGTQVRRELETLQLFNLSQFRPLLLAALDKFSEQEIAKLIRDVVVISMRYSIIGSLGTGNIERSYSDAAIAVRGGKAKTAAQAFSILKNAVYPDDERFESDFATKSVTKPKLARYILAALANELQPGKELEVVQDEKKVNLEHVMPKSPTEEWNSAAADEAEYLANVDRLGNMTLIEREVNRAAGNASFDKKKAEAFSGSDLTLTKQLLDYRAWGVAEITRRQKAMAKLAKKVWSV